MASIADCSADEGQHIYANQRITDVKTHVTILRRYTACHKEQHHLLLFINNNDGTSGS